VYEVNKYASDKIKHIRKLSEIGIALSVEKDTNRLFEMIVDVGNIVINNDQAVLQTLNLTLNSTVVDAMSDSGHTASLTEVENFTIRANDGLMADAAGTLIAPVANSRLVVDARGVSGAFALTVIDDALVAGTNDNINFAINLGGAAQTFTGTVQADVDTIGFTGSAAAVAFAAGTVTFQNATGLSTQVFNLTDAETLDFSTTVITGIAGVGVDTIAYPGLGANVTGVTTLIGNSTRGTTITDTSGVLTVSLRQACVK